MEKRILAARRWGGGAHLWWPEIVAALKDGVAEEVAGVEALG